MKRRLLSPSQSSYGETKSSGRVGLMESDWYFSEHGQPVGPTTFSYIAQLARLQPDMLVWRAGMESWTAVRDMPDFKQLLELAPPPLPPQPGVPASVEAGLGHGIRPSDPWRRLSARMIDSFIYVYVAMFLIRQISPYISNPRSLFSINDMVTFYLLGNPQKAGLIILFSYIPIEIILLTAFKRTIGKMIYRIELNGMTSQKSARRSLLVWWRGLGTGFPLISLISGVRAYRKLKREGVTSWDKDLGVDVECGRIPAWQWVLNTIALAVIGSPFVAWIIGVLYAIAHRQ